MQSDLSQYDAVLYVCVQTYLPWPSTVCSSSDASDFYLEVPSSNLDRDTEHTYWSFSQFYAVTLGKYGEKTVSENEPRPLPINFILKSNNLPP